MNRGDYFLTQEGQKNLLSRRRLKHLYFQVKQEPKSKNSIDEEEKKCFQQQVEQTLHDFKRRAYRSPVIMEIYFFCNQNNPPAIHNLAKNYLDLLKTPLPNFNIKRKRLLYSDDRLIKILIVNYHLTSEINSGICIKIAPFKNFVEDIKLVNRIIYNDFEEYDSAYNSFDINEIEQENNNGFSDPHEDLRDLRESKDSLIKIIGHDSYKSMEDFAMQDIQKDYLQIGNLSISGLISLFAPFLHERMTSDTSQAILEIGKNYRNMMISPPLALDLRHTPIKDGQTKIFKSNVKTILKNFTKQFPILSPFKTPLGVIVLYVPPKTQSIDLDNLARYIIPFVNETIRPPLGFVNSTNSIKRFQFIELPRFSGDSDAGYVRLIFDNPFFGSVWEKVDNVIDKWAGSQNDEGQAIGRMVEFSFEKKKTKKKVITKNVKRLRCAASL